MRASGDSWTFLCHFVRLEDIRKTGAKELQREKGINCINTVYVRRIILSLEYSYWQIKPTGLISSSVLILVFLVSNNIFLKKAKQNLASLGFPLDLLLSLQYKQAFQIIKTQLLYIKQ